MILLAVHGPLRLGHGHRRNVWWCDAVDRTRINKAGHGLPLVSFHVLDMVTFRNSRLQVSHKRDRSQRKRLVMMTAFQLVLDAQFFFPLFHQDCSLRVHEVYIGW